MSIAADAPAAALSPAERLLDPEEAPRFHFLQAVRLLEVMHRRARQAAGLPAALPDDAVRFRSRVSLAFPASDVHEVAGPKDGPSGKAGTAGGAYEMTVNFLGLAGVAGPLPRPLTELVLSRGRRDPAARDFLDLFNHRLVRLMYAARKKHRPALATTPPEDTPLAGALFALAGLGTRGLRGRMRSRGVSDRALLTYAGLLAQRPRSMAGLEALLGDYFGVPVRGRQFQGCWHALEEEDLTRIGRERGTNHALGQGALLGRRVWDQQAGFELEIGPLSDARFRDFLPTGSAYAPLCELVRFWVGVELDFTLRLIVRARDVSETRIGGPARLGWSSWLKTKPAPADDRQVVLDEHERVPPPPRHEPKMRAPMFFRG